MAPPWQTTIKQRRLKGCLLLVGLLLVLRVDTGGRWRTTLQPFLHLPLPRPEPNKHPPPEQHPPPCTTAPELRFSQAQLAIYQGFLGAGIFRETNRWILMWHSPAKCQHTLDTIPTQHWLQSGCKDLLACLLFLLCTNLILFLLGLGMAVKQGEISPKLRSLVANGTEQIWPPLPWTFLRF